MSDLALVVNNDTEEQEQEQGREYVKADTNNGYYRVANELGLALCKVQLSDRESRLVHAVMMKTFGYNKPTDWICNEQITELTGIKTSHIADVKRPLFARNILIVKDKKIGINPVISEWISSKEKPKTPKQGLAKKPLNRGGKTPKQGLRTPKQGTKSPHIGNHIRQDNITKDNITKDKGIISQRMLPDFLPNDLWLEFVAMRKSIKKPLTESTAKRIVAKLVKFEQNGFNPVEALTRTIDNCWADVFEPKRPMQRMPTKSVTENFDNKDYGVTTIPEWMQGVEQ